MSFVLPSRECWNVLSPASSQKGHFWNWLKQKDLPISILLAFGKSNTIYVISRELPVGESWITSFQSGLSFKKRNTPIRNSYSFWLEGSRILLFLCHLFFYQYLCALRHIHTHTHVHTYALAREIEKNFSFREFS